MPSQETGRRPELADGCIRTEDHHNRRSAMELPGPRLEAAFLVLGMQTGREVGSRSRYWYFCSLYLGSHGSPTGAAKRRETVGDVALISCGCAAPVREPGLPGKISRIESYTPGSQPRNASDPLNQYAYPLRLPPLDDQAAGRTVEGRDERRSCASAVLAGQIPGVVQSLIINKCRCAVLPFSSFQLPWKVGGSIPLCTRSLDPLSFPCVIFKFTVSLALLVYE